MSLIHPRVWAELTVLSGLEIVRRQGRGTWNQEKAGGASERSRERSRGGCYVMQGTAVWNLPKIKKRLTIRGREVGVQRERE